MFTPTATSAPLSRSKTAAAKGPPVSRRTCSCPRSTPSPCGPRAEAYRPRQSTKASTHGGSSTCRRGDGMTRSSPEGPGGGSAATRRVHRIRRRASGGQARCRMRVVLMRATATRMTAAASSGADAERLARQRPAEDDGHQRVDVGDGGEPAWGRVADQPKVGRVGNQRPEEARDTGTPRPTSRSRWPGEAAAFAGHHRGRKRGRGPRRSSAATRSESDARAVRA